MAKTIRIGTRASPLAQWQARLVQKKLATLGYGSELVFISAEGDERTTEPIYAIGIAGVFTRTLDIALLDDRIDIAVHSLKDVPSQLPEGIASLAVLKRASPYDVLVFRDEIQDIPQDIQGTNICVATGSLRRQAQWLNKYPRHAIAPLRGNVNTRLEKLQASDWMGAIFAKAGLSRIDCLPDNHIVLKWMIPAPAQGAIMVAGLEKRADLHDMLKPLHHFKSGLCTQIERAFLNRLQVGCSAPVGAFARIDAGMVFFDGVVLSTNGHNRLDIQRRAAIDASKDLGKMCADLLLAQGAGAL